MCLKENPSVVEESVATRTTTATTATKNAEGENDFYWSYSDEPHASRRKEILAKYPEIKKLYGHDPMTKYVTTGLVILQVCCASQMETASWITFFFTAYFIGGTSNHMLMLANHELSHNLCFRKMSHNRLFGLFANLPLGVPSSVSFKRYHMDHHRYQGEDGIDVDVPTVAEGRFFNSTFKKFFFVVFQVLFYAFRPLVVNPKKPTVWEGINVVIQISFDYLIYRIFGSSALGYLVMSSLLGSGLHPVAGHFIAEHYVFVKGVETYSYYGILNIFAFNVGYHNEHHDFPFVPGSRLPQVRAIASEYYDGLPEHKSWSKVIFDYITDPSVGAFSRVKRQRLEKKEIDRLKSQ